MCQGYEVCGLEMVDVKCFVSALKISWLRRILRDNRKITKILQVMCPLIQYIKQRGGKFSKIIIQRELEIHFAGMCLSITKHSQINAHQ